MKPKSWKILEMAIDQGVEYGWARAHKHNANPSAEEIKAAIKNALDTEMFEWFDFPELKD